MLALLIVLLILFSIALHSWWRSTRRPNPYGNTILGREPQRPTLCFHCGRRIYEDDAIRAVPGHLPMHERCARERLAVRQ